MNKKLTLSKPGKQESKLKSLKISATVFTNFPEACSVCNLFQCETDLCHSLHFKISESIEESVAKSKEMFTKSNEAFAKRIDDMIAKLDRKPPDENSNDHLPGAVVPEVPT